MHKKNSRSGKEINIKKNKNLQKKKYLSYSQQSLSNALDAVLKGLSIRAPSKKFQMLFLL